MIKYFPGMLSLKVAEQLSILSQMQISPIDLKDSKDTIYEDCLVIICPTLGDNELPKKVDLWLQKIRRLHYYTLILLADEDENWRKRCLEFELIKRLDQLGGRMIYEPFIIDSSQYRPFSLMLKDWYKSFLKIYKSHIDLKDIPHSIRIGSKQTGCYYLDFRTQEYYQRPSTKKPKAIHKILKSLLEDDIKINTLVLKYIGLYPELIPNSLIEEIRFLNIASSEYIEMELLSRFELRGLNLTANALNSMPSLSKSILSLHSLHLCKNMMNTIKGVEQYQELSWLSIYRNNVIDIEPIADCINLKYLNIGANPFTSIPESFSSLKKLETIQLRNSQIKELPNCLFDLPSLKNIILKKCKNIPSEYIESVKKEFNFTIIS